MKISVIWNWDRAKYYFDLWNDGLKAALEIIARDHEIEWCLGDTTMPSADSDFVLVWSDSYSASLGRLWSLKQPKGIFLTASPVNVDNLNKFNVVYAESPYIVNELRIASTRIIHAFGTNTQLFKPMNFPKYYEAFYPATFSPWKRQERFAEKYGSKGLTLGTIQPDGEGQYRACIVAGVETIIGYLPSELIAQLYNMSEKCHIFAWHGSERTALEALACGLPLEFEKDNLKIASMFPEGQLTRQFVLDNYSEDIYATQIMKGINGS